jgi:hypothetical protein
MLQIGPVTSLAGTSYSQSQILQAVFGPSLKLGWRFDLLYPDLSYKADLTALVDPSLQPPTITYDSTQAVKESLSIQMRPSPVANVLQDLVRVRFLVFTQDGSHCEWPIGIYSLVPPVKNIYDGYTWWQMSCPDLSQVLADAAFSVSTAVDAGVSYSTAIAIFCATYGGLTPLSTYIPNPSVGLPSSQTWTSGTSYLTAINNLLTAVNYKNAWLEGNMLTASVMPDYNTASPVLLLDATAAGNTNARIPIFAPLKETPDLSNAYNQILVTGQDPSNNPISAYYENNRPDSEISTVNWHPRLQVINNSAIANQAAAYAMAITQAQLAAQVYSQLQVETVPFPFFGDLDVIQFTYNSQDEGTVQYNYVVVKASHVCAASQPTTLTLQRIVNA